MFRTKTEIFCFIEQNRKEWPIKVMCKFYGVSRSGYYAWRKRGMGKRAQENAKLLEIIREIHLESMGTYGSPRVTQALHGQGINISENRTARLMQQHQIIGRSATLYQGCPGLYRLYRETPNRIHRLEVTDQDQVWVGDITYLKIDKRWFYLAVIIDLYSRRVIGWSLGRRRKVSLTLNALNYAVRNRGYPQSIIFHSDRGIEYASRTYRNRLKQLKITQSMNRAGRMTDNIYMESFFHSFKSDVYHGCVFSSECEMRITLKRYMKFYNYKRLHSGIGYTTPVEYEAMAA
ncbi:MAG: IS3 family transposase [Candidatus Thiodiazotropha endolucinida]